MPLYSFWSVPICQPFFVSCRRDSSAHGVSSLIRRVGLRFSHRAVVFHGKIANGNTGTALALESMGGTCLLITINISQNCYFVIRNSIDQRFTGIPSIAANTHNL